MNRGDDHRVCKNFDNTASEDSHYYYYRAMDGGRGRGFQDLKREASMGSHWIYISHEIVRG